MFAEAAPPYALMVGGLSACFDFTYLQCRRQSLRGSRHEVRHDAHLSPHGVSDRSRFILADTDQLHRKISEMSERIRQLEDALAIFQAGISSDRHPLLRDELLTIKFGPEVRRTVDDEHTRNALAQSIDALGTLTIGDHGETKYVGRTGGSEVCPCLFHNIHYSSYRCQ